LKLSTRNLVVVNALWVVSLTALLFLLVGGSISRISASQDVVRALESDIDTQQRELALYPDSTSSVAELALLDDALFECQRMAESQAVRIAALSASARKAGVTIVEMESLEPREIDQGQGISCTHRLVGTGNYRQLAEFLENVSVLSELNSINEVELSHDERANDETLRASFFVTWFAPGPEAGMPTATEDT